MLYSVTLLTNDDAKKYQVVSLSSFNTMPGLYFATLRSPGLPNLTVKLRYKPFSNTSGLYLTAEVREENNKIATVPLDVEDTLADKVSGILDTFKDVDYEAIKNRKERMAC